MKEKIHRITYKEYGHPLHEDGHVRTEDVGYFLTESKAIEFLRDGYENRVIVEAKELTQEEIDEKPICYMVPLRSDQGTKWTP
jgi:hypothetical protein